MSLHKHRCGFHDGADDGQPEAGCGHVFEHVVPPCLPPEERDRIHKCPKCGRGPWRLVYGHPDNANVETKLVRSKLMSKHPVDVHVGQKIRHRRWLTGMTQQGLAAAVGIKFQQIQKYESGANRCSASRLWDISRAMNVPVSYFFEGLDGGPDGDGPGPQEAALLQDKETAEIVRAYHAIPPEQRRRLLELARAMGEQAAPATEAA